METNLRKFGIDVASSRVSYGFSHGHVPAQQIWHGNRTAYTQKVFHHIGLSNETCSASLPSCYGFFHGCAVSQLFWREIRIARIQMAFHQNESFCDFSIDAFP